MRTAGAGHRLKRRPSGPAFGCQLRAALPGRLTPTTREPHRHSALSAESSESRCPPGLRPERRPRARRDPGWRARPRLPLPELPTPAAPRAPRRAPTWSSSLMSMKAGTLMVNGRLRKTLRSRTTPTGKGNRTARRYAQPLPGQSARAGLVGGARGATSSPRASWSCALPHLGTRSSLKPAPPKLRWVGLICPRLACCCPALPQAAPGTSLGSTIRSLVSSC